MATVYDFNDTIGASVTFTVNGSNADPDTVIFEQQAPDGVIVSYTYLTDVELIKDGTGQYHVVMMLDQAGRWWKRWEGVGSAAGTTQSSLDVDIDRVND